MKISVLLITYILFFSCCKDIKHNSNNNFPRRAGSVNDLGDIFSAEEEKILDSITRNFDGQSDVEITIISLDSTMTTLEDFNSYTLRLANAWGVNQEKEKKILIAISAQLQRMRINKGLGISKKLSGVHITEIMDVFMFPEFRNGNYFEGTRLGIEQLVKRLGN